MLTELGLALLIGSLYGYMKMSENRICSPMELSGVEGDGIILSRRVRLSPHQSNEHVLMVAPSGAGKTRKFIIPNVNSLKNCSLVVTDPSGEIERTCKTDKKVYILSPFNINTVGYDPLKLCKNEFEVKKIASVILKNGQVKDAKNGRQDEWVQMATPLLTAYMLYNYHTRKYNFADMIKNITTMSILPYKNKPEIPSIYVEIMDSGVESAITELEMFMQVMKAEQTLSSIRIVLNSCLQSFLDINTQEIFKKSSIDFSVLRKEQSIVYIQIPERHCEYYSPLSATFLTQLIDSLLDHDGLQTYVLFDEFTNIGIIPNMCQLLSTARKRKLSIVASIQSLTQLHRVYGEIEGKELRELFKTIMICSGLKDSAEYISEIIGKKRTVKDKTVTMESLMSPDEVRRMDGDTVMIICNNLRPVRDKMLDIVVEGAVA